MEPGKRVDPFRQYNFLVEFGNDIKVGFMECSGLETSQEIIQYREGNHSLAIKQLPGLISYSNIVLRRGMTTNSKLWEWREKAQKGAVERMDGTIFLLNDLAKKTVGWAVSAAWPVNWTGPHFDATGNGVAIETLEITHEGISIIKAGGSAPAA